MVCPALATPVAKTWPPTEIVVTLSAALPELVSITLCTGLVVP
jgi:hypothetical protein